MDFLKPYIRGLTLYGLKSGLEAAESAQLINSMFGEDTVSTPWTGFLFSYNGYNVKDWPPSGLCLFLLS